ncbi:uncharacterized protein LOC115258713 [Aedes albopictus]|uniref:Endonuclease n=1 Tax=Aedes albopictus TaxID=7160 RepID=A0ABM2A4H0_AEDAL
MSNKASSTRSRLSIALEDASQLLATGAIGGAAEGHEASSSNAAVVAEFSKLAIVNNAQREANGSVKSTTNARSNTATVGEECRPTRQVNVDISNSKKYPSLGTVPNENARARSSAIANNPVSLSNLVYNNPRATENPNVRVRVTRFSHCELCNERDTSSMVQCDGCDLWYHFSCVEVTSGIANRSWVCPACSVPDTRPAIEEQQLIPSATAIHPVDPPPRPESSRRSIGTTNSNRSNQRRITRRLQMLEEQKRLEQKYLEEKYRILDEEDGDDDTVVSDNEVGSMEMSKVRGWLIDTGRCGDDGDSGLVEEVNEHEENPIDQQAAYMERTGTRLTHEFYPHQRSTPREVGKTRNNPLQKPSSLVPMSEGVLRRTSFNVVPDNQFRRPPGTAIQFREQVENQDSLYARAPRQEQPHSSSVQYVEMPHAGPVQVNQQTRRAPPATYNQLRRETASIAANQMFQRSGAGIPISSTSRLSRPVDPDPAPLETEENLCVLNRSQLAARQAVSKELPEFYGSPEDWPLFFSMYNSSTQMCGFSNEENMLRLRRCLRGKALEAVRCRLLHPSNVNGVISTLRMLYGRPEAIVQASIRKIRSLPSPLVEKLETVVNFALTVENLVATIEACGIEDFVYNASLKFELIDRLPPALKLDWAKHSRNNPAPNLLDFSGWLYSIAEDATAVMQTSFSAPRSRGSRNDGFINVHSEAELEESHSGQTKLMESSTAIQGCVACNGSCTSIAKCKRFEELSLDARWAVVRDTKLCRKCLRKHNGICRQQKPCGVNNCSFLHHPLLHNQLKDAEKDRTDKIPTNSTGSCNVHQSQTSEILFRIVPVLLHGPSKIVRTYAFIDDGSELTLMEESLAEELGVKGSRTSLCLKWTSGTTRVEAESQIVDVGISATEKSTKPIRMTNVHTVESLQLRPQTLVFTELLQRFQHLEGLSIESYENVCPRILIGLDNASLGNAMKSREGKPYEPIAVKTRLGWIVYGSCSRTHHNVNYVNVHSIEVCECNSRTDDNLHSAMKNYFALDSLGIVKPEKVLRSADEERAMRILEMQTTHLGGRYETGLLWKFDNVRLPNSSGMAHRRWECLERRMNRDQLYADVVRSKMADYVEKGYVRRLTKEELNTPYSREWFLPVFPVVNPNKPGKVRLVWDAAATAYGVSLNSLLLKGPDLLTSLLTVLVKFRQFRIAVCGDIREMYLQISLKQDVRLCFFWKDSKEDKDASVYAMSVLPFGVSCAPSIAQYVKNINAKRFEKEHSAAVSAIVDEHYVDDMLTSVERKEEAVELAKNVKMIHAEAGFEMRNWISNCPEVLEAMEEQNTEEKDLNMTEGVVTEKVLGMWWNTTNDCFTFKISPRYNPELMSGQQRPTKREILRTLMMIFDPLGLIGHFLMYLKVVLQEIWRTPVGWDDVVEDKQFEMWLEWLNVLPAVAKVQIPRCYRTATSIGSSTDVHLHIFVDASEKGFAAVVYLRFQEEQTIETALVGSKTRVAPIKFLSIPRSELQACVIGVRFANSIIKSLSINVTKRFFWTDSSDVISWLKSDHRRYSQFVAFRVSEILEASDVGEWQWIQTKQNVADDGTKWKRVPDMSTTSRWFNGPEFLRKPESEWPVKSHSGATVEELRPHLLVHLRVLKPIIDPQRFSKWTPLLRRVAYVFRFIGNAKAFKHERATGPLTNLELDLAEKYLYRLAQRSAFSDEVAVLLEKRTKETSSLVIPKSSSIYRLCPFLDEDGVLRVRGRTKACQFANQDAVNPIILPRDHHITRLLVFYYHSKHYHQNHNTTINELRQRYSISHLKATYNSIRRTCQQCKNDKARPQSPSMGDLPLSRLAAYARPFTYMGVDYFGPYVIILGRRLEKRWVLLATCLTTRAIHLQIVHTMTTDSCIMALRNVMSRRGVPAVIYSDRGTNFQGASKELNSAVKNLDQERLATEFTTSHTSWAFIPPASPHMGGAWERLVRTVKQNLAKLKPNRTVSHEVLENMLTEIENVVNSRPMTDLPLDDDYSPVLTPNHFLLGSSNGLRTWVPFDDRSTVLKNSWKLSQALANQFWKQWLRDYLPCITRRTKWFSDVKPIEINDLVIIVDPKFPRNTWPKGRVIGIRHGADHQVRSATVQTASGIYERPAVKLAVLDVGVRSNAVQDNSISRGSVGCATSEPVLPRVPNVGKTECPFSPRPAPVKGTACESK